MEEGDDKEMFSLEVREIRSWRNEKYQDFINEDLLCDWNGIFTNISLEVLHTAAHTANSKGKDRDYWPDSAICGALTAR